VDMNVKLVDLKAPADIMRRLPASV
jgi:hypothetical protein